MYLLHMTWFEICRSLKNYNKLGIQWFHKICTEADSRHLSSCEQILKRMSYCTSTIQTMMKMCNIIVVDNSILHLTEFVQLQTL